MPSWYSSIFDLKSLDPAGRRPTRREALAQLHRVRGEAFGWPTDNFIGSTPQHQHHPSTAGRISSANAGCGRSSELALRNGMDRPW
jgi:fructosamine-3-kinase